MTVAVRAASDYAALCFHGLAYVPLSGPERVLDPRYQAHAQRNLPSEAIALLAEDGPAIAAALEAVPGAALAAQWFPRLHTSIPAFLATGAHGLDAVALADPHALDALRAHRCDGLEWLRTDLLLAAEAFAVSMPDLTNEARELEARAEGLALVGLPERFEIAGSLGPRGRGYSDVIIVGAPQPWWCVDEIDRAIPLVLAIHERAVRSGARDYAASEWAALRSVARSLHTGPLADPHRRWLASLDLDGLLAALETARVVSSSEVDALRAHPEERAERLARLDDR